MPLNIISNFAAQVAHRNLTMSDKGASSSVAKISAGTRVLGARDDAAALAIGSRLRAEVAAMQQASVNAGQAISMLQIADGAMSQINDTLVRMKSLSVQAGSDQLGSVERGLIDTEFQQLLVEIERIATDTEFNGQFLINGGQISNLTTAFDPGADGVSNISFDASVADDEVFQYSYASSTEILTVTKLGVSTVFSNEAQELYDRTDLAFAFDGDVAADAVFSYSYDAATDQLTLTNVTSGDSAVIDVTTAYQNAFGAGVTTVPTGESLDIDFSSLGVTVTFQEGFDFTSALAATTSVAQTNVTNGNGSGVTVTYATGLSDAAITKLESIISGGTAGQLALATTDGGANNGIDFDANADISFSVDGGAQTGLNTATGAIADGNHTLEIFIDVDGDGTANTSVGTVTLALMADGQGNGNVTVDFNQRVANNQTTSVGSDQSVQLDLTSQLDAVAGAGLNLQFDQTLDVGVDQFGVTLTLDKGFDRTANVTGTIGAVTLTTLTGTVSAASFAANNQNLTSDVYDALLALGYDANTGVGYNANTGILSLQVSDDDAGAGLGVVTLDGLAGVSYGFGDGNSTGDLVGAATATDVFVTLADGSSVDLGTITATYANTGNNGGTAGAQGTINVQLGKGVFYNQVDQNALTNEFTFKIGTGNESFDRITLAISSVNTQALSINGLDVTTAGNADAASVSITGAINTLNTARATVGAFQNRLDIATSNLATATENTEAARSALLDLDVAMEMTKFTSQQILVQAGVSMLAQANQLPQNLLRLLQ